MERIIKTLSMAPHRQKTPLESMPLTNLDRYSDSLPLPNAYDNFLAQTGAAAMRVRSRFCLKRRIPVVLFSKKMDPTANKTRLLYLNHALD